LLLLVATLLTVARARAADPSTKECLVASESSLSLRREFKFDAARAQALVCAAASCPADVRTECSKRVDELSAAMPTLVLEAKDPTGADLSAVRVLMDGRLFAERLEGAALQLDPGSHTFRFEGVGLPPVEKSLVIHEGEKNRREVVVLGTANPAPAAAIAPAAATVSLAPAAAAAQPVPSPTPRNGSPDSSSRPSSVLPIVGLVAAGVGVVALGVGSAFGLKAKSNYDDSNENGHCDASGCDKDGLASRDAAFSAAHVSTALFIAGGVLVAGGVTLYLVKRSSSEPSAATLSVSPVVASNGGAILVHGGF
jgi:hypothetical protein